jgi:DNA-binding FrmR family transcriptional regulator
MQHTSYPDIIKRLKQANGQLASILAMFEDGRSCRTTWNTASAMPWAGAA